MDFEELQAPEQVYRSASGAEYPIDAPSSIWALLAKHNPGIIDQVAMLFNGLPDSDEAMLIEDTIAKNPELSLDDLYTVLGLENRVKFFNTGEGSSHLPLLRNASGLIPKNMTDKDYAPYEYFDYATNELRNREGGHYPPPGYSASKIDPGSQRNLLRYGLQNMARGTPIVASLWKSRGTDANNRMTHGDWHEYTKDGLVDPRDEVTIKSVPMDASRADYVVQSQKGDRHPRLSKEDRDRAAALVDPLTISDRDARKMYTDLLKMYKAAVDAEDVFGAHIAPAVDPYTAAYDLLDSLRASNGTDMDLSIIDNINDPMIRKAVQDYAKFKYYDEEYAYPLFGKAGIVMPWAVDKYDDMLYDLISSGDADNIPEEWADGKISDLMARKLAHNEAVRVNDVKKFAAGAATGIKPSDVMIKAIRRTL